MIFLKLRNKLELRIDKDLFEKHEKGEMVN